MGAHTFGGSRVGLVACEGVCGSDGDSDSSVIQDDVMVWLEGATVDNVGSEFWRCEKVIQLPACAIVEEVLVSTVGGFHEVGVVGAELVMLCHINYYFPGGVQGGETVWAKDGGVTGLLLDTFGGIEVAVEYCESLGREGLELGGYKVVKGVSDAWLFCFSVGVRSIDRGDEVFVGSALALREMEVEANESCSVVDCAAQAVWVLLACFEPCLAGVRAKNNGNPASVACTRAFCWAMVKDGAVVGGEFPVVEKPGLLA
ncbi:hypothetical protein ACA910_009077 [Epithemia clementina (nom. ined.)]